MQIKGLDYGNIQTKIDELVFRSSICKDERILRMRRPDDENLLEFENRKVLIGEGEFQTENNKLNKEVFELCLITALARSSLDNDFKIMFGLPNNQYTSKHKELIKEKIKPSYEFSLGGVPRKINIHDIDFFPEGIAPLYGMTFEQNLLVKDKDVIIVNIGGGNTNVALLKFDRKAGKRRADKNTCTMSGMLDLYSDIIDSVNGEFGINKTIEDAEEIINKGLTLYDEKQKLDFLKDILLKHLEIIFKEINRYPIETAKVIFTGGGSKVLEKALTKRFPTGIFQTNYLMATAKGLQKAGEVKWQK